jgi:hypothetical protein
LTVLRIEKNHPLQVRQEFINGPIKQTGHVVEINTAFFIQRNEQGFFGRARRFDGLFVMDGALVKDSGLGGNAVFLVVMFQRQQQRQIRIAVEGILIDPGIDGAETGNETVISQVKLEARFNDCDFGAAVKL